MNVKRYRAVTLQEAFAQAQAELGEDTVLLHQKEVVQAGQVGRRGQTLVEITVGVDEPHPQASEIRPLYTSPRPAQTQPRPKTSVPTTSGPRQQDDSEFESLRREVAQIRTLLQRHNRGQERLPAALSTWSDALHECALPSPWVDRLLSGLDEMLTPTALDRTDMVSAALIRRMVAEMAPPAGPLQPGRPGDPLVFVLAGPTGVGKTTTIAKLAAHYALQRRLPSAIITADTFRIGAVSQLRTYSELMQTPLDVAYTPQELSALVQKHQDKAVIFIDTPGRSPTDAAQLEILRSFVEALENPHLQIALAAGTSLLDARRIVDRFSIVPPQGVILTKVDETSQFGSTCAVLTERQLPLSYLTTGQQVPEDIEVATNESLLNRLLSLAQEGLSRGMDTLSPGFPGPAQFQPIAEYAQLH